MRHVLEGGCTAGLGADAGLPRAAAAEHSERGPGAGQGAPRQRQGTTMFAQVLWGLLPDACPLRAQAMLTKWTGMLAEAGLRGKHVSFEPAGEAQVSQCRAGVSLRCAERVPYRKDDIVVRYGDARDFDTLVLECWSS